MHMINNLPQSYRSVARLALSLLCETLNGYTRETPYRRCKPPNFDIDATTGFLPSQPLPKLPETFDCWETALSEAPFQVRLGADEDEEALDYRSSSAAWRANIRKVSEYFICEVPPMKLTTCQWSVIDIAPLRNDRRMLQRSHLVLAFLVHYFVHSTPPDENGDPIVVPRSLAVPLVEISQILEMAPVLTFADTVLWNWTTINPDLPVSAENIRFLNLLSGTDDEHNFYLVSARAELRGAEILRIIEDYNGIRDTGELTSISKISKDLARLAEIIAEMTEIVNSVRNVVDPHVFYFAVRPWWKGSDGDGPSSPGWIFEGVPDQDKLDLSGPSAGQSSVMHALDIFLDIDHKLEKRRFPAPSENNKKADGSFMERMRRYMPGKHRDYLENLSASSRPLRELAQRTPAVREPYNLAVKALKKFRDEHIKIACLYVVTMSRSAPLTCPVGAMMMKMERGGGGGPARGTGGNELSTLLKAGRDATARAMLEERNWGPGKSWIK
ncbi:hypothetical protein JAAARDRAFT_32103 [Jaapia argillacea MUCL 33604]|uniref:Indoleamine 2,3-dioxygenase n=1 Tax=Jaapia argillacea MUCL 33604 TaxID=933084 RepID=A0A067Q2B2_9AGAM|nr:hypothetical protein JAAARDRAFT_32103 [Jaapia argillacea MUCL 33604]